MDFSSTKEKARVIIIIEETGPQCKSELNRIIFFRKACNCNEMTL